MPMGLHILYIIDLGLFVPLGLHTSLICMPLGLHVAFYSVALVFFYWPLRTRQIIGASLSEPHTSESALKCLSVCVRACVRACPWPHTVNVFFQYCVFSKFGFQIQLASLAGQAQDRESVERHSSNAERLSRRQTETKQARQEQDRERQR